MKLNERFLERINSNMDVKERANKRNEFLGLNVKDGIGGVAVFKNNWAICELEELGQMIEELEMLKTAIEEETGICF